MVNCRVTLPDVRSGMFAGAPPENVTLCVSEPFHSQVMVVLRGTLIVEGVNELSATRTVVTTAAAVLVNVTEGELGNPAAVAVAVWSPKPDPRVRAALA